MLTTGSQMGHFEIGACVGAGGMGEVYEARDTVLGRQVALKILPSTLADDPERRARLEREARLLATLNHPNIASIYSLEQTGEHSLLVMELVPGETLDARLKPRAPSAAHGTRGSSRAMSVDEALSIARQIADGLEAAHAKGIVHRDLKPANVKITPQGTVKILDFGLAKALGEDLPGSINASLSPTVPGATAAGVILGTAAYMSPEQARGKPVDAQSDIWAFGCVLFEMLTGRQTFEGETVTDTLAAIVRAEPDWATLPAETPSALRTLLKHCLSKDPDRRLRHIGDARLALEDAKVEPAIAQPVAPATTARSSRWLRAVPWAIALVALVAAALAIIVARQRGTRGAPVTRLELNLPPDVELYSITNGAPVSIAPDGHALAFVGIQAGLRTAFLRQLDQPDSRPMRGAELAMTVFFSPDNASLAVMGSDGTLKKLSLSDGLVNTLVRGFDYNSGGTFGPDGRILFTREGAIWEVPPSGAAPKPLTELDAKRQETSQQWPIILPGGQVVLFTSYVADKPDAPRIDAFSLADRTRRVVVERAAFPMYAPTGHLIFLRDGALLAAPFDARRLETAGPAARVVEQVAVSGSGAPMAAVSATGTLVYAPGGAGATNKVVWVSRQGAEATLTDTARHYASPHLSPDGRRIALVNESNVLWLQDTTRSVFTRLTAADTSANYPVWTRDGQRVVYRSASGIRWIQTDGSGQSGSIAGTSQADYPCSVSPDGETLVFLRVSPETSGDVYLLSLHGDPNPRPLMKGSAYEGGPQFSPDGRWIAYASNESGPFQVYIRPFPGPDRRVQVSTDGGSYPLWSRKGNELFYRNGNRMMAVDISAAARDADLTLSAPKLLFEQRYAFVGNTIAAYDVSVDGQRFVFVKQESGANKLNVVLNWFEELKQRVPTR